MGKIYCGARGSGKTTKLLMQASAIAEDGLIPVVVACRKDFFEVLKDKAYQFNINTDEWVFLTFKEAMESANRQYFQSDRCRVFIDELYVFIKEILFGVRQNAGFYATLSSEDCIEIERSAWEKK